MVLLSTCAAISAANPVQHGNHLFFLNHSFNVKSREILQTAQRQARTSYNVPTWSAAEVIYTKTMNKMDAIYKHSHVTIDL